MKPAELKAWLEVLPPNTAAVEIGAEGIKLQFFPPIPIVPPEVRPPAEPPEDRRAAPGPDATMLALMAQNGQA